MQCNICSLLTAALCQVSMLQKMDLKLSPFRETSRLNYDNSPTHKVRAQFASPFQLQERRGVSFQGRLPIQSIKFEASSTWLEKNHMYSSLQKYRIINPTKIVIICDNLLSHPFPRLLYMNITPSTGLVPT